MTGSLVRDSSHEALDIDPRSENAMVAQAAAVETTRRLRDMGRLLPDQTLSPNLIETDYWSFTLPLATGDGRPAFFMKIPKTNIHIARITGALRDDTSFVEGQAEYDSLLRLHSFALSNGLPAIKPVLFLAQFNAIVTEFVHGDQLFERCRASALWPRRDKARTLALLVGAGHWLRLFHDVPITSGTNQLLVDAALAESVATLTALQSKVAMRKQCSDLLSKLKQAPLTTDHSSPVMSVPGFEVRNLLVSDRGAIPLDPGRLAPAPRAADLAHFIVSMEMLFWGTAWFMAGFEAPFSQISAFLSGYRERRFGSSRTDRIFLTREWTRQWASGHLVLEHAKRYPAGIRWLVAREYLDRRFVSKLWPLVRSLVME